VSGKEDYGVIKVTCGEVFQEINDLIDKKSINVNGQDIPLDFYLSGDYKVRSSYLIHILTKYCAEDYIFSSDGHV
jgi:hypothetical protein